MQIAGLARFFALGLGELQHRGARRDLFLEKRRVRAHGGLRHKHILHGSVFHAVGYRQHTHSQMMRHVAAHPLAAGGPASGRGKINSLDKSEAAYGALSFETPQVCYGGLGLDQQGEEGGVGGYDQLPVLTSFQGKVRAAVRLVAVIERGVEGEKRAFGYAPEPAAAFASFLNVHTILCRLVQQAVRCKGQKELRHEVLEHGTRPACHSLIAAGGTHGS